MAKRDLGLEAIEDDGPNHLRAWRELRELTQDELGALAGTNGSVISLLESGGRKLSPKWLRKLAPALDTMPGVLLDSHPDDVDLELLKAWMEVPTEDRPRALQLLRSFKRTGTDG